MQDVVCMLIQAKFKTDGEINGMIRELVGLPGISFIEGLLCRGVNHLGNEVQVIN